MWWQNIHIINSIKLNRNCQGINKINKVLYAYILIISSNKYYKIVNSELGYGLFHASDPSEHAWRYRALADALRELDGTAAFREFEGLIDKVFGK